MRIKVELARIEKKKKKLRCCTDAQAAVSDAAPRVESHWTPMQYPSNYVGASELFDVEDGFGNYVYKRLLLSFSLNFYLYLLLLLFAGSMHDCVQPALLQNMKDKSPNTKIFGQMPKSSSINLF